MDKSTEMSLDEVLSSIKKMVIDEEPPVLELTDMVSKDGTIVKIKKDDVHNTDMKSFLKLVQENAESSHEERKKEKYIAEKLERSPITYTEVSSFPVSSIPKKQSEDQKHKSDALHSLIEETANSLIKNWIQENLPNIASKVVETEVRKLINKN